MKKNILSKILLVLAMVVAMFSFTTTAFACEGGDCENPDRCNLDSQCCSGYTCTGHKCKIVHPQCKTEGDPCGGNNECCSGLTCIDSPNNESDKCGYPCTPKNPSQVCPTECGLSESQSEDGCGGFVNCPATEACEEECVPNAVQPTKCGYNGEPVEDGCGGFVSFPATEPCPVDPPDNPNNPPAFLPQTGVDYSMENDLPLIAVVSVVFLIVLFL